MEVDESDAGSLNKHDTTMRWLDRLKRWRLEEQGRAMKGGSQWAAVLANRCRSSLKGKNGRRDSDEFLETL